MEKLKITFCLFIAFMMLPIIGCDDDEDRADFVTITRLELLTASEWTGYAIYVNEYDIDSLELAEDPWNSDSWDITNEKIKFNEDGTYKATSTRLPAQGVWEFTNGNRDIKFNKNASSPGDRLLLSISELTSSELYLAETIENMTFEMRMKR